MDLTFGCVLSLAAYGPMAGPTAIRTLAQRAETLGFHTIWFADHIVIPRHVKPGHGQLFGRGQPNSSFISGLSAALREQTDGES
jgi:alkanesulfonate monooxygenase SsuD/methylene tetrahydromethanopterin reductase-like flavin-dependent oxidoreductase (luciferase family)